MALHIYYTLQERHILVHLIVSRLYWHLAIRYIQSLVGPETTYVGNRLTLDSESQENSDLKNIFERFPKHVFFDVIFVHFYLYLSKIENGVLFNISSNSFRFQLYARKKSERAYGQLRQRVTVRAACEAREFARSATVIIDVSESKSPQFSCPMTEKGRNLIPK